SLSYIPLPIAADIDVDGCWSVEFRIQIVNWNKSPIYVNNLEISTNIDVSYAFYTNGTLASEGCSAEKKISFIVDRTLRPWIDRNSTNPSITISAILKVDAQSFEIQPFTMSGAVGCRIGNGKPETFTLSFSETVPLQN